MYDILFLIPLIVNESFVTFRLDIVSIIPASKEYFDNFHAKSIFKFVVCTLIILKKLLA